jgi:tRNA(Ile)-lysidine synthase
MAFFPDRLFAIVNHNSAPAGFLVAFSGGRDSSVLLDALSSLRDRLPAPLRAMHVNHGLHPDAARWARHCEQFAAARNVACCSQNVVIDPADPRGLEAAARAARYAAFEAELRPDEWLLTAHHADDQLETVLLQLLRGGGPAGIAGMPAQAPFGTGWLARPLLTFRRDELTAYADANGLRCITDPSNADTRRDRNFLRHEIIPCLKQRWPAATTTATRSARHAAHADSLLHDLADLDLARIQMDKSDSLPIDAVLSLGQDRAANLLRRWLCERELPVPDTRRLNELLAQAKNAASDRVPEVTWAGAVARCWRGRIHAFPPPPQRPVDLPERWHGKPLHLGPGLGELRAVRGDGGLRANVLAEGVKLRFRKGGEIIRPVGHQHHRKLKDLLREANIAPWLRDRIPLLWFDNKLVAVGELWVAHEFAAKPDETSTRIERSNSARARSCVSEKKPNEPL